MPTNETTRSSRPLFRTGQTVMTSAFAATIALRAPRDAMVALQRHIRGDWGDVCAEDKAANDAALREGGRLLSSYSSGGEKFWIITEADRSATTFLLPSDY